MKKRRASKIKKKKIRRISLQKSRKYYKFLIIGFLIILLLELSNRHFSDDDIKYLELVDKYSKEYDVDRELILGVIEVESDFRSDVTSNKGRIGLMQIMPDTAKWISNRLDMDYSKVELKDPDTNIKFGTYYLHYLIDRYSYLHLALAAYNGGLGNVDEWIERGILSKNTDSVDNIPFKETKEYVKKVLKTSKGY